MDDKSQQIKAKHFQLQADSFIVKHVLFLEKNELYIVAFYIVEILLVALRIPFMEVIVIISAAYLAAAYFASTFKPLPDFVFTSEGLLVIKLAAIGSAVAVIALMGGVMNWTVKVWNVAGALVCAQTVFFALTVPFKLRHPEFKKMCNRFVSRGFVLGMCCATYYFTPREKLIEYGFSREVKEEIQPTPAAGNNTIVPA